MKNLYRRYRPVRLEDVVGQTQVTEPLMQSLKQGKVSHAYLFIGPRGTGKTSVARIFAHEINKFKYEIEDDYVDIVEIDGASNRGIDNIRELREKVNIAPTSGRYKVYIIDEVHMLTKEAFNALLKTLEEPPEHAIFIMATTDAYKVPITITSRAQTYTFKLADSKVMSNFLSEVAKKEKIKITDEAINIIVKRGGGSFRDSLSLLDQISTLSDHEITKDLVISTIGLPEDEKIKSLINDYTAGDLHKITKSLKDLLSSGIKPETIAEEIILQILSEPKPDFLLLLSKLPEVRAPFAEAKLLLALSANIEPKVPRHIERPLSSLKNNDETATNDNTTPKSINTKETNKNIKFEWENFVEKVRNLNDAVYSQLLKTSHELIGNTLHIYPEKKIVKTILSRENNKRILTEALDGLQIQIHDIDERPTILPKDEVLSKISAIMGGEVKNARGGNPFEE